MEIITSLENKTVKHIAKLHQKKYRDEFGEFVAEGYRNVYDTLTAARASVKTVVLSESAYKKYGEMFDGVASIVVSDAVYAKLSDTSVGQGVLSVNKTPPSAFPSADRCIMLDRIRDPGNLGTILRTAVAAGYDVVADGCTDIFAPKVVRSAMSAIVKCRIGIDIDVSELKKAGYEIIVADMDGESAFGARRSSKFCVVIGNEAEGVGDGIIALADRKLCIPQSNMESLNAAVAAGIMMFALK